MIIFVKSYWAKTKRPLCSVIIRLLCGGRYLATGNFILVDFKIARWNYRHSKHALLSLWKIYVIRMTCWIFSRGLGWVLTHELLSPRWPVSCVLHCDVTIAWRHHSVLCFAGCRSWKVGDTDRRYHCVIRQNGIATCRPLCVKCTQWANILIAYGLR